MTTRSRFLISQGNLCHRYGGLISILAVLCLAAGVVNAQENLTADTLRNDSIAPMLFKGTLGGAPKSRVDYRTFRGDTLLKSPWGAVLRSLIIPGWGQWYNESKWKAPLFITTDGTMLYFYNKRDNKVQSIERKRKRIDRQLRTDPFLTPARRSILMSRFTNLTNDLDGALDRRNLYGWLFALSHLMGMIDAYVDAHLFDFDSKMDLAIVPAPSGWLLCWKLDLK